MYTYIQTCILTYIHVYLHTDMYTYIHTCILTQTCILTYIHVYLHTDMYTYIHTCILTYRHAYSSLLFYHLLTSYTLRSLSPKIPCYIMGLFYYSSLCRYDLILPLTIVINITMHLFVIMT